MNLSKPIRAAFIIAALLLIIPETITDIIGLGSLLLLMFFVFKKSKSAALSA